MGMSASGRARSRKGSASEDDEHYGYDYHGQHRQKKLHYHEQENVVAFVTNSLPLKKRNKLPHQSWTEAQDRALLQAILHQRNDDDWSEEGDEDWDAIAESVPGKSAVQCLKRYLRLQTFSAMLHSSGKASNQDGFNAEKRKAAPAPTREGKKPRHEPQEGVDAPPAVSDRVPSVEQPPTGEWEAQEVVLLRALVEKYQQDDKAPLWNEVASHFANHNAVSCLIQWQSMTCPPPLIKGKGSWTPEEDHVLLEKLQLYGRKWAKIASFLPGRQGKQCRERYVNHLNPEIKKCEWTEDEEAILIFLHQVHGNRWSIVAKQLPGRCDNDVKNHWYSIIQRKFATQGKEKLIQAAEERVHVMQQTGTMPSQQKLHHRAPSFHSWAASSSASSFWSTVDCGYSGPPHPSSYHHHHHHHPPPGPPYHYPPPPHYYLPPPPSGAGWASVNNHTGTASSPSPTSADASLSTYPPSSYYPPRHPSHDAEEDDDDDDAKSMECGEMAQRLMDHHLHDYQQQQQHHHPDDEDATSSDAEVGEIVTIVKC